MDCSIDLETLSTKPNAHILSIGAVFFDPYTNKYGDSIEITLSPNYAPRGLHVDADTALWWMKQSEEARAKLTQDTLPYNQGIKKFALWLSNQPLQLQRVWANSPSFDLQILKTSFELCHIPWPFKYWAERDIRTIKDLAWPNGNAPSFIKGTAHGALDDATAQAALVIAGYQELGLAAIQLDEPDKKTPREKANGAAYSSY